MYKARSLQVKLAATGIRCADQPAEVERIHENTMEEIAIEEVEKLASSKGIVLMDTCRQTNVKCGECTAHLPTDATWYTEEILYFGEPMIKYWFIWGKELQPAAYSWPIREKTYLCPRCFDNRKDARNKRNSTRQKALKAASKCGIELIDGGPYYPGRKRRHCRECSMSLTNRGWYSSLDNSRNNKQIYICWDVKNDELVPLAVKVGGLNDVYVCLECHKNNGEKV
jgi:hypothetical protein